MSHLTQTVDVVQVLALAQVEERLLRNQNTEYQNLGTDKDSKNIDHTKLIQRKNQ